MYNGKIRLWSESTGEERACSESVATTVKLIAGHLLQARDLAETFTEQTSGTDAYLRDNEDIGVPIAEAMEVIENELFSSEMPPIPVPEIELANPIVLPSKNAFEILRARLGRPAFDTFSRAKEVKSRVREWEIFSILIAGDGPLTFSGYIVETAKEMYSTYKKIIEEGLKKYGI